MAQARQERAALLPIPAMQRLRAGLLGLGLVMMMTMAASLLADAAHAPVASAEAAEPLAKLGVAPSADPGPPDGTSVAVRQRTAGSPQPTDDRVTI